MKRLTTGLVLFSALVLGACQTTTQASYPLTLEQTRAYGLSAVKVNILNEDEIVWTKYQKRRKLIADGQPIKVKVDKPDTTEEEVASTFTETDEVADNESADRSTTYVKMSAQELRETMILAPMRDAFKNALGEEMQGEQKVVAEIDVKSVKIHPVQGTNYLIADFRLIDKATNTQVAELNGTVIKHKQSSGAPVQAYSLGGLLLGIALDTALDAARSQIGKDRRYSDMSADFAGRTRKWIAPAAPKSDKKKKDA